MQCSFTGCNKDAISNGLCRGHYTQRYRGQDLTPLKPTGENRPVVDGKKTCRECKKNKPVSEFYQMNRRGKLSTDCKPCYSKKVVKGRK